MADLKATLLQAWVSPEERVISKSGLRRAIERQNEVNARKIQRLMEAVVRKTRDWRSKWN